MNAITLKSGNKAVKPPHYSAEFRAAMRRIGAQWQDVTSRGTTTKMYVFPGEREADVAAAFAECFPGQEAADVPVPAGPFAPLPPVIIPAVGVVAGDGRTYAVVGGEFHAMQANVKSFAGRRWNAEAKLWKILNCSASEIQADLDEPFRLIPGADLEAEELRQIEDAQQQILAARARIEARMADLDAEIGRYSRSSTSSVKGGLAREQARLRYALQHASTPVDRLTEPEIRTLLAVVREDLA